MGSTIAGNPRLAARRLEALVPDQPGKQTKATTLLLFGATGDLAARMLLPSLCALDRDGLLPPDLKIVGTARSAHDDASFRALARAALEAHVPAAYRRRRGRGDSLHRLSYSRSMRPMRPASSGWPMRCREGGETGDLPVDRAEPVRADHRRPRSGRPGRARTSASGSKSRSAPTSPRAATINDAVAAAFPEERIFRIDHYLGKETVQNLLALRFANLLFEPLWNAQHIDHVQITVAETVGLEGRAGYYDGAGALRDMVQNHMLQLLALVAMEPPSQLRRDRGARREGQGAALAAPDRGRRGQRHRPVPRRRGRRASRCPATTRSWAGESDTETFVAIKAHVDNWRWKGVPFYLRTGKRLPERRDRDRRSSSAACRIRSSPARGAQAAPNRLVIGIQPEENITPVADGQGSRGSTARASACARCRSTSRMADAFAGAQRRIAYERLLLDLIEGDQTLFVRRDEVEAQWDWIDAIRAAWAERGHHAASPTPPAAGARRAAIALAERDGRSWHE